MSTIAGPRLEQLSVGECVALLAQHHFGRVAIVVGDQPVVFPVNYALSGRDLVFRTGRDTELHRARGQRVAFEIDSADAQYHDGWSVVVKSAAREETDPARIADLAALPLTPWASGARSQWMCIEIDIVTGRRITHLGPATRQGE